VLRGRQPGALCLPPITFSSRAVVTPFPPFTTRYTNQTRDTFSYYLACIPMANNMGFTRWSRTNMQRILNKGPNLIPSQLAGPATGVDVSARVGIGNWRPGRGMIAVSVAKPDAVVPVHVDIPGPSGAVPLAAVQNNVIHHPPGSAAGDRDSGVLLIKGGGRC
jgi:hypothetical protein